MFGWRKRRPQLPAPSTLTVDAALEVVARFGAMIEHQGTAILDTSKLPLPKSEMKVALRTAWRIAPNDRIRHAIEADYVYLAQFQDGVGDKPADCELTLRVDPAKDALTVDRWLAWSEEVNAEMAQLLAELDELKRATPLRDNRPDFSILVREMGDQ